MLTEGTLARLRGHLTRLYGEDVSRQTLPRLADLVERSATASTPGRRDLFDQSDVFLITYGDQVREPGRPPLVTLREFLDERVGDAVSGMHLLPHYPATSDDGFAVADYLGVDPDLGEWEDVELLGTRYRLMLDAVLNHTSASHPWFRAWLAGDSRYLGYYLEVDPATDLSAVTRPRTSPLLTPFEDASRRTRWVWTTFSADQVDLNYANPEVLLSSVEVLLQYLAHGAGALRLDAVAFLWKQPGTSCIHLAETHEIIRLWRTVADAVAPGTLLVTETNVPHRENVTYFGSGTDEAHLVYQFALPPLTLAAFHSRDATALSEWVATLSTPSPRATFLNFLASHDGIGLRPVEGLLEPREIDRLVAAVTDHGGLVSYRAAGEGQQRPYELNSVYLDALRPTGADEPQEVEVARHLSAHSILLALAGVPAVYVHSLLGSRNWVEGVRATGRARSINRRRFDRSALESELTRPTRARAVLAALQARIAVRAAEPAFHPAASQERVRSARSHFAVQRTPQDGNGTLLCVHDVSGQAGRFRARPPDAPGGGTRLVDLLDGSEHVAEADGTVDVDVPAYGVRWLRTAGS